MGTIADNVIATLRANGVTRDYGVPGDSLNGSPRRCSWRRTST